MKLYNISAIKSAEGLPFMIFDVENDMSNMANYTLEITEYHN